MARVIRTDDLVIIDAAGTGLGVPAGTTAQRPGSPPVGTIRYNTDGPFLELWDGASWNVVGSGGGGGAFVQKSGDTMTGNLVFTDFATVRAANAQNLTSPSYAFRDDATTGLGRLGSGEVFLSVQGSTYLYADPAADTLTLRTAATGPLLTLLPSGRVGIGTTSPSVELEVAGTGAVRVPVGTTAQRPATPASGMIRFNTTTGVLEYHDGVAWQTVVSSATSGTVTSVDVQPGTAGLATSGGPITTSGTITVSLANDVAAIEALVGTGFAVRTGTDTWVTRSLTSNAANIIVTNPDGAAGAPYFDLAVTGVAAGSYTQVTVDTYGRVTAGAQASISDLLPPTANVDWNGYRIVNLADPVDPQDAVTLSYVTTSLSPYSLDAKDSVRVATASVSDLTGFTYDPLGEPASPWTTPNNPSFDGVLLDDGDRVLVKDAGDQRGNGIFVYDAAAKKLRRPVDSDDSAEVTRGQRTLVVEGASLAGTIWYLEQPVGAVTFGVDNLVYQRVAAGVIQIDTGTGLTGGPITTSGTISLDGQALEFHNLASDGFVVRSGSPPGNVITRVLTGATKQIVVSNADGAAGDPLIGIAADPVLPGIGAVTIPAGASTDRPTTPTVGMIRVNTSASPPRLELWDGTKWTPVVDDNYDSAYVLRAGDSMAGTLGIVSGSVGAPGLSLVIDPTTGLYSTGSGVLGVAVNGQQTLLATSATGRLRFSSPDGLFTDAVVVDGPSGTVGIGAVPAGLYTLDVAGNLRTTLGADIGGYVSLPVESGITATGTDLSTAYGLTRPISQVTAAPVGSGVRLDANMPVGSTVIIVNEAPNAVNVYPHGTTASINLQAPGTPVLLPAQTAGMIVRIAAGKYWTI